MVSTAIRSPMISVRHYAGRKVHDDLEIKVLGVGKISDGYYFVLDPIGKTFAAAHPSAPAGAAVLEAVVALFNEWRRHLIDARPGDVLYLPYDLTDQACRVVRCSFRETLVSLETGWTLTEGWSFYPSDISPVVRVMREFEREGSALDFPLNELLAAVDAAITSAKSQQRAMLESGTT